MWFSRQKIGAAAKEIVDHLQIVETVKALQVAQRELSDALVEVGDRLRVLEIEMRVTKAETQLEALKETQAVVNAVQGRLNQRLEALSVKVGIIENALLPRQGGGTRSIEGPSE